MLTYTFEQRNNKPYYQYLYECIKEDIEKGNLTEGAKLPSKRAFAKQLGLSVMTIASAYEQLLVEGYIVAEEKKGYYVAAVQPQIKAQMPMQQEFPVISKEVRERAWYMDFASNHVARDRFPMNTWSHLMRGVLNDAAQDILNSTPPQGVYVLRQAIASHLFHFRGMRVVPEQIVIGAGTEYLYHLLIQLLGRDHIYGMENPGYQKLAKIYAGNGVNHRYVALDEHGLSMTSLREQEVEIIHTTPTHHFPTGIVMPISRRQKLLAWATEKEGRYIIEDDYDCEFRYSGHAIPALYGLDASQRVIYMNTFSKTLSPGIRISYMVLPPKLLEQYVNSANFFSNTSSNLEQHTLAAFLRDGYFDRHLNRMRRYYLSQGEKLKNAIQMTPTIPAEEILGMETGTHILVKLKTKLSDKEIKLRARMKGINLCCLSEFCIGEKELYRHVLVLNYSGLEESHMLEVAGVLGEIFV